MELAPADQEIRDLIRPYFESYKKFDREDQSQRLQRALELAERRGLVGDKAVVEAHIAFTFCAAGDWNHAFHGLATRFAGRYRR